MAVPTKLPPKNLMPQLAAPPEEQAPAPKPTPPVDKQWSCKIEPAGEGELTVGRHMLAHCEGESVALDRATLTIENREDFKYALRLLQVKELNDHKAELVVTSWLPGELKVPNPVLTDGHVRVGMGDQEYTFVTVIKPEENPEGKPFPPLGPMSIAWPIWLWLVVAAGAALVAVGLGFAIRRSLKRKRLLTLLEKNATALSPFNHFNKELRRLTKQIPMGGAWALAEAQQFFKDLQSDFRWFLARELVIPAIDGSPRRIVSEIKRADRRLWDSMRRDLRLVLGELEKAQKDVASPEDAMQLAELCRTVADRIVKERGV